MRDALDKAKHFGANNLLLHSALKQVEKEHDVNFLRIAQADRDKDKVFYPQFPDKVRREAAAMAQHYEIFYCLELSVRQLISERLSDEFGTEWWEKCVPEVIRKNAAANVNREKKSGVTPRSTDVLSYTNFGELGEIIKANWKTFSDMLSDVSAVEAIFSRLNTLRAPIAHCCFLAEDEVLRLKLSVRDWFRQMSSLIRSFNQGSRIRIQS